MALQQFFAWAGGPAATPLALALRMAIGLLASLAISYIGYRQRSLSRSGLYGAILVGTLTFGLGGWVWGLLLIAFFATSSALSHYRSERKTEVASHFAKTGRRDLGQVLASGGLGAALAVIYALSGGTQPVLYFAFAGVMATVNADTWATELGVLSRQKPQLITTGEPVEPGTSGAVSWLGLTASFAGAWLIGFLGLVFQLLQDWLGGVPYNPRLVWLPLVAACGGLAGSFIDSLLGATLQATYYCLHCGEETEQTVHRCGRQPIRLRGWIWMNNDWVNLLSSLGGALLAFCWGLLALYL